MAAPYEPKQRFRPVRDDSFPARNEAGRQNHPHHGRTADGGKVYGNRLSIMSAKQAEEFSSTNECNFAISLPDTSRFRVNAMIQRGATALVFRAITSKIPKFESLNLPFCLGRMLR